MRILSAYNIHRPWFRSYKKKEIIKLSDSLKSEAETKIKGFSNNFLNLKEKNMKYHPKIYIFCNKF